MDKETHEQEGENKKSPTYVKEHINMLDKDTPKIMAFEYKNWGKELKGNDVLQHEQTLGGKDLV